MHQLGDRHWRPIHDFRRNADALENELIDLKKLKGTPFGRVYEDYCRMLRRYHFLTYGQLVAATVEALKDHTIFEKVHGALKHLIVDEYQDINPAQEKLIGRLAEPPVQLCVVGDDDQAIYQWRGSDVENIQTFVERFPKVKTLPLATNRRSRPKIIQVGERDKPRLHSSRERYRGRQCELAVLSSSEARGFLRLTPRIVKSQGLL